MSSEWHEDSDFSHVLDQPCEEDIESHKQFQKIPYDVEQAKRCAEAFRGLLKNTALADGWAPLIAAVLAGKIESPVYVITNWYIRETIMECDVEGLESAWDDFVNALAGYDLEKHNAYIKALFEGG